MNFCSTCNEPSEFFCKKCNLLFCKKCWIENQTIHEMDNNLEPVVDNSKLVIIDKEDENFAL